MNDLRELYQELIIDHSRSPRNHGKLPQANLEARGHNPLCGDKVHIYLKLNNEKLVEEWLRRYNILNLISEVTAEKPRAKIYIDDKEVTWSGALTDGTERTVGSGDSNFYKDGASLITVEPHYGTDGQSASSLLSTLSSWGSNHKLSGLCYLALRFKWNQDAFTGIPKVQAKIQGKKVVFYNSGLAAQTAAYKTNPAWCLLDYLTNTRYGKGIAISEIDLQSFYDASVVCETQVTPYSGASDINIFDTNAAIDTSQKIIDNVREMLKGCRGYLPYTNGKYKLIIETTGSAAITLTEDDIIGNITVSDEGVAKSFNTVILLLIPGFIIYALVHYLCTSYYQIIHITHFSK